MTNVLPLIAGLRTWINAQANKHFIPTVESQRREAAAYHEGRKVGFAKGVESGKDEAKEIYSQMLAHFEPFSQITIKTPEELLKMVEEAYQEGSAQGQRKAMVAYRD